MGDIARLVLVVSVLACGEHRVPASSAPTAPARTPPPVAAAADGGVTPSVPSSPPALSAPIDLLHATRTDVAVSSAYRDKRSQADALVDGSIETAWNSRTGELAGAWIEVRLPAAATVTSLALTVGFTRRTRDGDDLFAGNHRVSKIRVLRDGRELGVFSLDPESRELQSVPVSGPGGTLRIEVVEVVPGTKPQWREVCVSELRILGRAPGAQEGQRVPRTAVGALPPPRPEPGATDRAEVARLLGEVLRSFQREWGALQEEQDHRNHACALEDDEYATTGAFLQRRRQAFGQVADLVDLVDELAADRLRLAGIRQAPARDSGWQIVHDDDLAAVSAALDVVVTWLGDGEAECRARSLDARLRFDEIAIRLGAETHSCEHVSMDYPEEGPPRDVVLRCRMVENILPRIETLRTAWRGNARLAAERTRGIDVGRIPAPVLAKWNALVSRIEPAQRACGWSP